MDNLQSIFEWPINKIESEFCLVSRGLSDLSANQRKTVVAIYRDRLEKGLLTKQKALVADSMDRINKAVWKILEDLAENHGLPADTSTMRRFTIAIMPPEGEYIADYHIYISGVHVGKVIVDFQTCKFVENGPKNDNTTKDK